MLTKSQNESFSTDVLEEIHREKHLQIWVPKRYGGLGLSIERGLEILLDLAERDGSLAWFVTLCGGANFFSRNLKPEIAKALFEFENVCFGGSGMITGTAEKRGDFYLINGTWNYATGAPFLTHFTLNAQIMENGVAQVDEHGQAVFLSFLLEADDVEIVENWDTMGMNATASHGFSVKNKLVSKDFSFKYDHFYGDELLDRIPFEVFADLTLLANYIGMAKHFEQESAKICSLTKIVELQSYRSNKTRELFDIARNVELELGEVGYLSEAIAREIHFFGEEVVLELSKFLITIFPHLGIKAASFGEEVNKVFRDFFTATQHRNFRKND